MSKASIQQSINATYQNERTPRIRATDLNAVITALNQGTRHIDEAVSDSDVTVSSANTLYNGAANLQEALTTIADAMPTPGSPFQGVYFVATNGTANGEPGSLSHPYTVEAAFAAVQPGETIIFFHGTYTVAANLARQDIHITTLGGVVTLNCSVTPFDFSGFSDSAVSISGNFILNVNAAGGYAVKCYQGTDFANQNIVIDVAEINMVNGFYALYMPIRANICYISCSMNISSGGAITAGANGFNSQNSTTIINIFSSSPTATINLDCPDWKLEADITTTAGGVFESYTRLKSFIGRVVQSSAGVSGIEIDYVNTHWVGGVLLVRSDAHITGAFKDTNIRTKSAAAPLIAATLKGGFITFDSSATTVPATVFSGRADDVAISVIGSGHLHWTGTGTNISFLTTTRFNLAVYGTLGFSPNQQFSIYASTVVNVLGEVVGDHSEAVLNLTQLNSYLNVSGQVTNTNVAGAAINVNESSSARLKLKSAELYTAGGHSITVQNNAVLDLVLLGDSYTNYATGGTGTTNYIVGSAINIITDPQIS